MSDERDSALVGTTAQAQRSQNRLSLNRLSLNSLSSGILVDNPLSSGALGDGSLSYNAVSGLETTPEGRELLEYAVRCALAPEDILVVEHDGVTYAYPGVLGLAPEWQARQLSASEESYVSACLITHVNAYGTSVSISTRSPGVLLAGAGERQDFPVYEGSFFGKVFGEDVKTYACIGDVREVALAHSSSRSLRSCTDPSDDCGVVSVGRCQDVCEVYHPGYGWTGCWAEGARYAETISAFLHDDGGDSLNQTCGFNGDCAFECNNGNDAILDCSGANTCSTTCTDGSTCTLDGAQAGSFTAAISQGSLAQVACHEAATSNITCTGSNCDVDCTGANECHSQVTCTGGAQCMLECNGAVDCGFDVCEGAMQVCAGGEVVCNRACPGA